jgi:uncharacterized repeat protein (TIGR01451 family)
MTLRPHLVLAALAVFAALAAPQAQAQRAPEQQALVASAANMTAIADETAGRARASHEVQGDDVVRYSLVFTNVTDRPVREIVLANPVPAGFQLLAGSVAATDDDTRTEFSADGGQSFSPQPMEEVVVDGQRIRRAISPERYTHVRWTLGGWVAPQASVTAHFDVRLRAGAAR